MDQDLADLLLRLGLRTLGDFAALPVRDVASRFGEPGEYAHRLARGLDSRPLATRPPPAALSVAGSLYIVIGLARRAVVLGLRW